DVQVSVAESRIFVGFEGKNGIRILDLEKFHGGGIPITEERNLGESVWPKIEHHCTGGQRAWSMYALVKSEVLVPVEAREFRRFVVNMESFQKISVGGLNSYPICVKNIGSHCKILTVSAVGLEFISLDSNYLILPIEQKIIQLPANSVEKSTPVAVASID